MAGLGAARISSTLGYTGSTPSGFEDLLIYVVLTGRVRMTSSAATVLAGAGDITLPPLGVPVQLATCGFDMQLLRLPADRVRQAAEDLTGSPGAQLRFHGMSPVSPAMARYWRSLTVLAAGALGDVDSPMASPLLAGDLARTLATVALRVFPNSTMTRQRDSGPGRVAPAAVRRAVAYLEANADRVIAAAEVAAAAGTGARALQYGFRRHLGTTPSGYLRKIRLARARGELQHADPMSGLTVAVVAARWGFATPSAFAAAYRAAHGESPSTTLRT